MVQPSAPPETPPPVLPEEQVPERFAFFRPKARLVEVRPASSNINLTWILLYKDEDDPEEEAPKRVVLQRLNPKVFPDTAAVMANFRLVTAHLARARETDPKTPEFPLALASPEGEDFQLDEEGGLWRLISYIGPSKSLESLKNARQAAGMGAMLARFHLLLADLDTAALVDPLPGFHDTPAYLARYDEIAPDKFITPVLRYSFLRFHKVKNEREEKCRSMIEEQRAVAGLLSDGALTRRTVHGDPKCANFLFTKSGASVRSLIDLDTVREGLLLHDLADALRSCCARGGENARHPQLEPEYFSAFLSGYFGVGGGALLPRDERELIPDAMRLLCFELGLRFFTDVLEGGRYFASRYDGHTLDRACSQLTLAMQCGWRAKELRAALKEVVSGA